MYTMNDKQVLCFNSSMVRLKVKFEPREIETAEKFQFQYGTIKSLGE